MRIATVVLAAWIAVAAAAAESSPRFGIDVDSAAFPQATPKEAFASLLKAIEAKRIDYLLAHLADPEWVDKRVKDYGGSFKDVVSEATAKLIDDPGTAKQLRRLQDGEWKISDTTASLRPKEAGERWAYFRKVAGRWVFENRFKPETADKDGAAEAPPPKR